MQIKYPGSIFPRFLTLVLNSKTELLNLTLAGRLFHTREPRKWTKLYRSRWTEVLVSLEQVLFLNCRIIFYGERTSTWILDWFEICFKISLSLRIKDAFDELRQISQLTFVRSNSTIETLRRRCEIYSKLTIKTPERHHCCVIKGCCNPMVSFFKFIIKCFPTEHPY